MITEKAGCFLIKKETKEIALIYRKKQNDYSFPKGHVEKGETLKEAAIRETAEETKRIAKIVDEYEPFAEKYITPRGENCVCYMFFALDNGVSDNQSEDTHDIIWTQFANVEDTLSYDSLKNTWNSVKDTIIKIYNSDRLYGTLRISNMIPVPIIELEPYVISNERNKKY